MCCLPFSSTPCVQRMIDEAKQKQQEQVKKPAQEEAPSPKKETKERIAEYFRIG